MITRKFGKKLWTIGAVIGAAVFSFAALILTVPDSASAHEVYVLTSEQFMSALGAPWMNIFSALANSHNLTLTILITIAVAIAMLCNVWVNVSRKTGSVDVFFGHVAPYALVFVRVAVGLSFIAGAYIGSFLGPEISLVTLGSVHLWQALLMVVGLCLLLGLITEFAALVGLYLYLFAALEHGVYVLSYASFAGALVVLLLFGSRIVSLDHLIFRSKHWTETHLGTLRPYKTAIVRICFGVALLYTAVTVKLLHPAIPYEVVTTFGLTQFNWLFPGDPLMVTLGATLAEIGIALCVIVGFELRLVSLVSIFYMTLSLVFFREALWPHLILYACALVILVNPGTFTVDHVIRTKLRKLWNQKR